MATAPVAAFFLSAVLAVLILSWLLLGAPLILLENTLRQIVRVLDRTLRNRYSFLLEKTTQFLGDRP